MGKPCVPAIESCSCISSARLVRRLVWRCDLHQSWVNFTTPHELLAENTQSLILSKTRIKLVNTREWSKNKCQVWVELYHTYNHKIISYCIWDSICKILMDCDIFYVTHYAYTVYVYTGRNECQQLSHRLKHFSCIEYCITDYFPSCKFSQISRMGSLLGKIYSGLLHEVWLWVAMLQNLACM